MKNSIKANILLVEDDPNLSLVLQDYLEMLGYQTVLAKDGDEGLKTYISGKYDLCILDVMMPKIDGFSLAEEIRNKNSEIPIIFLTAKSLKEDRIKGFHKGCDDYITKPFSTEELSLRIEAILRRCRSLEISDEVSFGIGKYLFDFTNMLLILDKEKQKLTKKESELLRLLCLNKNKLLSREKALKTIWGDDDYFIGRSMDVFITKLRKYLKADPSVSITNVHGTGFKLEINN
ncbi:response regulator transcription factor [Bacteroidota bacterium]